MKWEYKWARALDREELNKLGENRWELVAVDSGTLYFKREKK